MAETLELFFAPGSSSMAPHIALQEIGCAYEPRPVSFARRQTRSAAYLAINPEGKVPTLLIDGRALTEVAGILWYLARRHPEADLLPGGGIDVEAQVISWMSYLASSVHPSRRQGTEAARAAYGEADRRLGAREWAGGGYSIADIHLFRLFWRFFNSLQPAPGDFPNLFRHYEQMMAREAVRRTIAIEAAVGYELPA